MFANVISFMNLAGIILSVSMSFPFTTIPFPCIWIIFCIFVLLLFWFHIVFFVAMYLARNESFCLSDFKIKNNLLHQPLFHSKQQLQPLRGSLAMSFLWE